MRSGEHSCALIQDVGNVCWYNCAPSLDLRFGHVSVNESADYNENGGKLNDSLGQVFLPLRLPHAGVVRLLFAFQIFARVALHGISPTDFRLNDDFNIKEMIAR